MGKGSDSDQFDVATGGADTDDFRVYKRERLRYFNIDLAAPSGPVLVRASHNVGGHGHVLVNGWLRAPATGGSEFALVWHGDLPLEDGVIQISVRNDSGATVTVRYNWVIE